MVDLYHPCIPRNIYNLDLIAYFQLQDTEVWGICSSLHYTCRPGICHCLNNWSCSLPHPLISCVQSTWSLQKVVCHVPFLSQQQEQADWSNLIKYICIVQPGLSLTCRTHSVYSYCWWSLTLSDSVCVCFHAVSMDEGMHCPSYWSQSEWSCWSFGSSYNV